jgi:hypothetical protein
LATCPFFRASRSFLGVAFSVFSATYQHYQHSPSHATPKKDYVYTKRFKTWVLDKEAPQIF